MSEWTSRVRNHRIWGSMKALGPRIDEAVRLDELDSAALEALERLRAVLAACGKRLGGTDPLTVLVPTLDSIAAAFESQKSELDAFIADRDATHLTNANAAADTVLAQLAQIPGISTPEEVIGLVEAVASHRTAVEEQERLSSTLRKQAKAEVKELTTALGVLKTETQSALSDLRAQLDLEKQKISTQASEQQKLFVEAQESRSNAYNETLLKIQESLTKTLTEQQGQFSSAQENRGKEFSAAQADAQKRFGDLIADYAKRLADQDAAFTKQRDTFAATAQEQLAAFK